MPSSVGWMSGVLVEIDSCCLAGLEVGDFVPDGLGDGDFVGVGVGDGGVTT